MSTGGFAPARWQQQWIDRHAPSSMIRSVLLGGRASTTRARLSVLGTCPAQPADGAVEHGERQPGGRSVWWKPTVELLHERARLASGRWPISAQLCARDSAMSLTGGTMKDRGWPRIRVGPEELRGAAGVEAEPDAAEREVVLVAAVKLCETRRPCDHDHALRDAKSVQSPWQKRAFHPTVST